MRLYHYTCLEHWASIARAGALTPTASNMSRDDEHAGPPVVWLTTAHDPSAGHELPHGDFSPSADKHRLRFTVDVPTGEVHPWRRWARLHGIHRGWEQDLSAAGGSGTWRVVLRPIPSAEWVGVRDMLTGMAFELPRVWVAPWRSAG